MENYDDVLQILKQLNVHINTLKTTNDFAVFEIPDFGIRVVWSLEKYEEIKEDWTTVVVYPQHTSREVRETIMWALAKNGFFHYLRMEYPNTFKQMLSGRSGEDWHKKIITKRLEFFGDKPKYKYFKDLNSAYLRESFALILSLDPGFYDMLYWE